MTLSSDEANGTTYYTIDGTEPTEESPVYNGEEIIVSKDSPYLVDELEPEMTIDEVTGIPTPTGNLVPTGSKMLVLKAFTTVPGKWDSSVVTYEYVIIDSAPEPQDSVTITYDLNGGTYGGSPDNIVEDYERGTVIKIHAAPIRDGYTFLYWKGSEYQPNDSYEVIEDHTFVAQWKKEVEPGPGPEPTPGPEPKPTPEPTPVPAPVKDKDSSSSSSSSASSKVAPTKTGTPASGDMMQGGPVLLSVLVLCGAVALVAARRMRTDRSRDRSSKK